MKKSRYTIFVKNKTSYLLFNTLTNSCVILSHEEFNQYNTLSCPQNLSSELFRLGFYVDDNLNELNYLLARNRFVYENSRTLGLRIFTTTKCNARCFYCYENGINHFDMSKETADLIILFIKEKLPNYNSLKIQWFGGEPLINYEIINYIVNEINPILKERNINFSSTMISNGYLFDEEIVKMAKDLWKLKKVQITLDGLKETYQSIKLFSDPNAFERVLKNISLLAQNNIKVSIRLNYSSKNFNEILSLIDFLADTYKNTKNISVYAKRIFEETDVKSTISMDKKIYNKLLSRKFISVSLNSISPTYLTCMAKSVNNFVFNANGAILKCARAITSPCGEIGSLYTPSQYNQNIAVWANNSLEKKCNNCKLLPLCCGGCEMERILKNSPCLVNEPIIKYKLKKFLNSQENSL